MESLSSVPYDEDFTSKKLKFASGKAGDTIPGSLYFESGRIRLGHKNGPKISRHEKTHRYLLGKMSRA